MPNPISSAVHFLQRYFAQDAEDSIPLAEEWGPNYEADLTAYGYQSHRRTAAALAACAQDKTHPLLDLGCGTGLSAQALTEAGFTTIDGVDRSEAMLAEARCKPYFRNLIKADFTSELTLSGDWDFVTAIGVITPHHAPPQTMVYAMELLAPGGLFAFTLNDITLKHHEYTGQLNNLVDGGYAEVVSREYGLHLTELGMGADVYVLRKR